MSDDVRRCPKCNLTNTGSSFDGQTTWCVCHFCGHQWWEERVMSDDVRRWSFTPHGMAESKDGKWVEIEDYEHLHTRIEELEAASIVDFEARDKYLERIGRLEAEVSLCETHHKPGHYLSDKQIDVAWELAGPSAYGQYAEDVLRIFHIVECEECNTAEKQRKWAMLRQQCPACQKFTGHGWVIKGGCDD
jgi:hypothetical protein